MNGVHDMGGMHGFGPVRLEDHEPVFHAPWERRALGLTVAMGASGQWNLDQSRFARESLAPAVYLGSSYYRIWVLALEQLMQARGLVTAQECQSGRAEQAPRPLARVLRAATVDAALARGAPTEREVAQPARFAPGQRVRARQMHPAGHTRLPRYVRGHLCTVERVHGAHVFPDRHAATPPGQPFDEAPQWLYTVRFEGAELWGPDAEPGVVVSVGAWESYLEPAA